MMPWANSSLRRHPDGWAIASLVAVSLIFLVLFKPGVSSLHGDDLIQNYPLRVFVGEILRSGHLPAWNPYIWSGTPLLAGFNAGAAYPLTWLFAALPGPWAWTLTLGAVYALAASGFYCFMRELGHSRWASWMAAATFAFAGFMISQMVHLGTIEGVAWVGWIGLFVTRLARSEKWPERLTWTVYLGVSAGLVILTGSPEPMAFGAIFAAMTAFYALWDPRSRRGASLLAYALAGVLALLLSAVQWVPGLAFIHISQRHAVSLATFGSMSLPPIAWIFFIWPYIHGGYSRFLAPINYRGPFNLPEISGYVGLLPILAGLSLVVAPWNKENRRLVAMYYTWGIVGVLLSAGRFTPLEAILYHLPFYHGIRAQNRNLFMVDAALAALFATWLDMVRTGKLYARRKFSWRIWVPGVIFAALFLLCLHIGMTTAQINVGYLSVYIVVGFVLGSVALGIYFGLPWLSPRRRMQLLTAFAVVDLGLYAAGQYWLNPPVLTVATGSPSLSTRMTAIVGTGGRYGIYDPQLAYYPQMEALNEPDLNLLNGLKSFQGYGSLVSARYQSATSAHGQGVFNPRLLSRPLVNKLNVTTVFTVSQYLLKSVGAHASSATLRLKPGEGLPDAAHPWFFGMALPLRQVRLNFPSGEVLRPGPWKLGALLSSGRVRWYKPTISRTGTVITLSLPSHPSISAIVIRPPQGFSAKPSGAVITAGKAGIVRRFVPNAPLTGSMPFPQWRYEGHLGSFSVFRNTRARGWFWLGYKGRVKAVHTKNPNQIAAKVDTPAPTRLYWSQAYSPGWTATISHAGITRPISDPPGVIQSVKVPKGRSRVIFRYRAPELNQSLLLSVGGIAVALAIGIFSRRKRPVNRNA